MAPAEPLDVEDWLQLAAALFAVVIGVVAWMAYRRRRTRRAALIAIAFSFLMVRSLFIVLADFVVARSTGDVLEGIAVPLEVAFLALVMIAFLRA